MSSRRTRSAAADVEEPDEPASAHMSTEASAESKPALAPRRVRTCLTYGTVAGLVMGFNLLFTYDFKPVAQVWLSDAYAHRQLLQDTLRALADAIITDRSTTFQPCRTPVRRRALEVARLPRHPRSLPLIIISACQRPGQVPLIDATAAPTPAGPSSPPPLPEKSAGPAAACTATWQRAYACAP